MENLMLVLGRFAMVIDQLNARCAALGAETESLREQLRRVKEEARREQDVRRVALEQAVRPVVPEQGPMPVVPEQGLLPIAPERPQKTRHAGDAPLKTGPYVRPYAMTKGRTTPRRNLAVEALVSSTDVSSSDLSLMTPEYHDISVLCRQPRSIAEISSLLNIPLGVVRVLVADMAAESLVYVHEPPASHDDIDRTLLQKVLAGLRKL